MFRSQAGQSLHFNLKIIPVNFFHRALRFLLTIVVLKSCTLYINSEYLLVLIETKQNKTKQTSKKPTMRFDSHSLEYGQKQQSSNRDTN